MPQHTNFYETHKEALMRLRGTVVLYDKQPYIVIAITNHFKDGIFRIYLDPTGRDPDVANEYPNSDAYNTESTELGPYLDKWLDEHPNSGILRKQMNSPLFNKFRPFPLGMANMGKQVYYLERAPARPKTEQGLTRSMVTAHLVTLGPDGGPCKASIDVYGQSVRACITGEHPDAATCLRNLTSGEYDNEAVAFNRDFALLRGPIDMVFLAYKTDIVGALPKHNFDNIRLGKDFHHCREVVEGLRLFGNIIIE